MEWQWFLGGLFLGASIGFFTAAIMAASGVESRKEERNLEE